MSNEKDYEEFLERLAETIKSLRLSHGLTQEDMVDYGFNYRHYQRLESGKHSPSLNTIYRLSVIYDIKTSMLFQ